MGRKLNNFIREFYTACEKNEFKCKICSANFVGNNVANLKRHMTAAHMEQFEEAKKEMELQSQTNENKRVKFYVEFSKNEVSNACIALATKHSLPFSYFDTDSFKTLVAPIFEGLNMTPVTSTNISELIGDRYVQLKNLIKTTVKNRVVSLKMDSATRFDRSVLGINLQLINDRKLVCYTLAIKDLHTAQTSQNLKIEVQNILNDFGISLSQIYTFKTDNGRNMIKAVSLLNEVIDMEREELQCELPTVRCSDTNIISIKCAAHTLQLAIKDFVVTKTQLIDRARHVVKTLRTPNFRHTLQMLQLGRPQIDVPTRWNSTFVMLDKLILYKDVCLNNLKDLLSSHEWSEIEVLVTVLKPAYTLTLQLQEQQLILGDFYKSWLTIKILLKEQLETSPIPANLLSCIQRREPELIENDVVIAALFLYPRFRRTLTCAQKLKAKHHLKHLAERIILLKEGKNSAITYSETLPLQPTSDFLTDDSINLSTSSLLRSSIRELEVNSTSEDEDDNTSRELLAAIAEIDSFKPMRLDVEADLLQYWEEKKYTFPFLRKLVHIVPAVPATQVSVERAFSALRLLLTDKRCNLTVETLAKTLFVKLNSLG